MAQALDNLAPAALIVGCGYLGRAVAMRLLKRGRCVYGTTRTRAHAERLFEMGVRPMLVQITQPVTYAALTPALKAEALDVYYLVPPGRPGRSPTPRQVVLGGVAHLIKALRSTRLRRGVLTSSTLVYSQRDGRPVDADTPAQPADERGQLLLQGENLWLDSGRPTHVLRLAGLYGPQRVIGLGAVREGAPLVGDPQALLNLIHVDDAADLLISLMTAEAPGRIELGCDGHPVPRIEYYRHLARRLGVSEPAVLGDAEAAAQLGIDPALLRRNGSRACDNVPTCRRCHWSPRYADYRAGLDAILPRGEGVQGPRDQGVK